MGETRLNKLTKEFGPQISNWLGVKRLQTFINKLPTKEPLKFPTLPTQSPPTEVWYWEELSDLFVNRERGGKNYREVLYQSKKKIGAEISHFSKRDRHCPYWPNPLGRQV